MTTFVVSWDGDVDEFGGGVRVAEGEDRDVDVGGFFDGLCVGARVGDDDQSWFLEGAGDVVGEVSGGEATCDCDSAGVGGEFEDCALAVGAGGDDADVGWVVDCGDNAGCEDDFLPAVTQWSDGARRQPRFARVLRGECREMRLPSLSDIDHVDSVRASLPQIRLHVNL
jgi:hypothetical protein